MVHFRTPISLRLIIGPFGFFDALHRRLSLARSHAHSHAHAPPEPLAQKLRAFIFHLNRTRKSCARSSLAPRCRSSILPAARAFLRLPRAQPRPALPPRPPLDGRGGGRRPRPRPAAGLREGLQGAVPARLQPGVGDGHERLHRRHLRARDARLEQVARHPRGLRPGPPLGLPAGGQGDPRVLRQDDGGRGRRRRARRPRLRRRRAARRPEAVRREGPVRDAGPRGALGHRQVARQLLQGRPLPRRRPGSPPALKKGQGVVYGTHGLGIKYEEWRDLFGSADIDAFHESCGITASSAGPLIGKASSDMKAKNGVGVVRNSDEGVGVVQGRAEVRGRHRRLGAPSTARRTPTRCTCARARSSTRRTTSSRRRRRRRRLSALDVLLAQHA